ncbi:MAG: type IV pilus assembly protein PilM [bacterium]
MSLILKNLPFALDIGELTLKLVQLKKIGKIVKLTSFSSVDLPEGCIQHGEIRDQEQFKKSVELLFKKINGKKIKTKNVISVLPEPKTFIKWIKIESESSELKEKKYDKGELIIPEIISRETEEHIPLPIKEIYLDWQVVSKTANSTEILIGAAPKSIVNNYLGVLKYCGFEPVALEIESMAIIRSLFPINKNQDVGAKMIIDFGRVRTSLIIFDQNNIKFTVSLPISGKILTETIAKRLNISLEQAEKAKIVCSINKECQTILTEILTDNTKHLIQKIKEAINFYKDHFTEAQEINELVICGGGANLSGLEENLKTVLGKNIKKANPLVNIGRTYKSFDQCLALKFTTALGLALRGVHDKNLIY